MTSGTRGVDSAGTVRVQAARRVGQHLDDSGYGWPLSSYRCSHEPYEWGDDEAEVISDGAE